MHQEYYFYPSKNTVKKAKYFLIDPHKSFPFGPECLCNFLFFHWPTVRRRKRSAADPMRCHQNDEASWSVSSVASESPMISQLETELLMWVGLRPLPDRVSKPKLQPSREEEGDGWCQICSLGLELNIVQDWQRAARASAVRCVIFFFYKPVVKLKNHHWHC